MNIRIATKRLRPRVLRSTLPLAAALLAIGAAASASSTVTVSPPSPLTVLPGQTVDFTATVGGNSSPNVTWTLQEASGGYLEPLDNVDVLYTAPATAGSYHLNALDSLGGSAIVNIVVSSTGPVVSVSPGAISLQPGAARTFTAKVANVSSQAAYWGVEEGGGGSIDYYSGAYTAPAKAGLYHVRACTEEVYPEICGESAIRVAASGAAPSLQVLPLSADVALSGTQTFIADLFGISGGVNWTVQESSGGSIDSNGVYTAPAKTGTYHVQATSKSLGSLVASSTIKVIANGNHASPRIWLNSATLSRLQTAAAGNTADWLALKSVCDNLVQGNVHYPDGTVYKHIGSSTENDIYQGYEGSDYYSAVLNLGMAYQILKPTDATTAAKYATQAANVLMAMSGTTPHAQPPSTDDGYGIRFYVPAMAIGMDWLYAALTSPQRTQLIASMHDWIAFFERSGFENSNDPPGDDDPANGNYFAGYYSAKALAALAAEGDDAQAPAMWTDWLERVHGHLVEPDFLRWMGGGGAPEGWNYSPFSTENYIYPALAAQTAKGLKLVTSPQRPFHFPWDMGDYTIEFTWPDLLTMDDRGTLYSGDNPAATQNALSTTLAYLQTTLSAPSAPWFHNWARQIRSLQADDGSIDKWQELLFWDNTAPEDDYTTLPLSFMSTGTGEVAMRSSWDTNAVWASFRSAAYIANGAGGHEYFDQGGLAIVRGGTPLLLNSTGEFERNTPGQSNGGDWDNQIYDDLWNTDVRDIFNVFYAATDSGNYGQAAYDPTIAVDTRLNDFEDGDGYVRMRGAHLEELYRPGGPETSGGGAVRNWTRDVIYLRPQIFVIYDRTSVDVASRDQWMAWHFGKIPTLGTAAETGSSRWDIKYNGSYAGAMTTVLPVNNQTTLVNVFNSGHVYRVEERPAVQSVGNSWLTVFDASSSAGAVSPATRMTAADGNITAGKVQGVLLASKGGNNIALFNANGTGAVSGRIAFTMPAAATRVILIDLPGGAGYSVTATPSGGNLNVAVTPGSGFTTTRNGTLYLQISVGGGVSAGS